MIDLQVLINLSKTYPWMFLTTSTDINYQQGSVAYTKSITQISLIFLGTLNKVASTLSWYSHTTQG